MDARLLGNLSGREPWGRGRHGASLPPPPKLELACKFMVFKCGSSAKENLATLQGRAKMSPAANEPSEQTTPPAPRRGGGTWLRAEITLSDGRRLEIRIPAAVSGSVSSYTPEEGEVPSIFLEDEGGKVRRGRLTQLFGT